MKLIYLSPLPIYGPLHSFEDAYTKEVATIGGHSRWHTFNLHISSRGGVVWDVIQRGDC